MLSTSARKATTVGEMTNLITTNAQSFDFCLFQLVSCVSAPIQLAICIYMLYQYIGIATFAGMASMILFLPANYVFSRIAKKIRKEKYKLQDSRIKMMNEIFNGIRVLKFYGWEVSFQNIIIKIRDSELTNLIKSALLSTLTSFTWAMAPITIATVAFAVYIFISDSNNLDPSTAFVSLTLFNMLRFPLNIIPYIIQGLIQVSFFPYF
jgi:ABC-type multidrug transport system fused ATPase/permease subunit